MPKKKLSKKFIIPVVIVFILMIAGSIYFSNIEASFDETFNADVDVQKYLSDRGLIEQDTLTPKIILGISGFVVFGMLFWTSKGVKNDKK